MRPLLRWPLPRDPTIAVDGEAITCAPHCGDGSTTSIPFSGTITPIDAPPLRWYCFSTIDIGAGTLVRQGSSRMATVALFSDGDAIIRGRVDFSGGDATVTAAGAGGLGAGAGGALSGGEPVLRQLAGERLAGAIAGLVSIVAISTRSMPCARRTSRSLPRRTPRSRSESPRTKTSARRSAPRRG